MNSSKCSLWLPIVFLFMTSHQYISSMDVIVRPKESPAKKADAKNKEQRQNQIEEHTIINNPNLKAETIKQQEFEHQKNSTKSSESQAKDLKQYEAAKKGNTNNKSINLSEIEKDIHQKDLTTNNPEQLNRTNSINLSEAQRHDVYEDADFTAKKSLNETPQTPKLFDVETPSAEILFTKEHNLFDESPKNKNKNYITETYSKVIESFQKTIKDLQKYVEKIIKHITKSLSPGEKELLLVQVDHMKQAITIMNDAIMSKMDAIESIKTRINEMNIKKSNIENIKKAESQDLYMSDKSNSRKKEAIKEIATEKNISEVDLSKLYEDIKELDTNIRNTSFDIGSVEQQIAYTINQVKKGSSLQKTLLESLNDLNTASKDQIMLRIK